MKRTITVKGIGRLSLKPDLTVVSLKLKTVRAVYDEAMDEAAKRLEQLRSAITEIGFAKDDLKTTDFDVGAEYESERDENGNYKRIFVGYRVTHGLKLEFDFDSRQLSRVLAAIAACIAEPELNVRFTVKDREAVNAALLENACANAREQAQLLADASGVKLHKLLSVSYNWGELQLYSPTDYEVDELCMMKAGSAPAAMDIEPDEINVRDSVTFVWRIK